MTPAPLEKDTCRDFVLPRLRAAGWTDDQIQVEFPITAGILQRKVARRFVRHEHRDLVHQLLKDFGRRFAISENADLVLDKRMGNDPQRRKSGGGVHGAEATNFARMKEYQAVMLRLSRHARDDEDALTDLLNERSRGGWRPAMMSQDAHRLTLVFERPGDGEG